MKRGWLFGLLGIGGFVAGTSTADVFEVSIVDAEFLPPTLTVAVGDSIHWTNNGSWPHTVDTGTACIDDGEISSGTLVADEDFGHRVVAGEAGRTIDYFCDFHCSMGMIAAYSVNPVSPTVPTSWGWIKLNYR